MATGEAAKANAPWRRDPAQAIQLLEQYNTGAGYRDGTEASDVASCVGHSVGPASDSTHREGGSLSRENDDQATLVGGQGEEDSNHRTTYVLQIRILK